MKGRVALLRPVEDAESSADALRARGFEPVLAPVTVVAPTGFGPPPGAFDAVLATSANALRFLSSKARDDLRQRPLYVVGEQTAAAAKAVGFGEAVAVAEGGAALAALLVARLPAGRRFLYLAARDRKSDLESALLCAGHAVAALEVYRARAIDRWSEEEAQALARCGAALHYSRRSAEIAAALAERAGIAGTWRTILHVCISKDAGEPLRLFGAERIVPAKEARETSMLDTLEAAFRT